MKTRPRGIWATFTTTCPCGAEITITNGYLDPHQCQPERKTIKDALADYYVYGDPPPARLEDIKFR